MHFNDGFTDYETEPKSFAFRIGLFKRVKDSSYEFWLDADAIVADLDRDPSWAGIVRPHRNRAVFWREFASVAQKVPENLLQARCVGDQLVSRGREGNNGREMSLLNLTAHDFQRRLQELMRVGLAQLQRQLSGRDAGQVEPICDQASCN